MNISQEFETIAAISTPLGNGGVGVIRISGENSFKIAKHITKKMSFRPEKFVTDGFTITTLNLMKQLFYHLKLPTVTREKMSLKYNVTEE